MHSPIQIGRSYKEMWFLAHVVLAAGLVAGGTLLFVARQPAAPAALLAGCVAAVSACLAAMQIARSRFQIELTAGGFLVRDRRGVREFRDEQVICAGLSTKANYANGILRSTTRTFDVWVEGERGTEQVKMVSRLPVGDADPLAPLIERVFDHLYERAAAALDSRQAFEGEGWTLHANELVVHGRRSGHSVRFLELAAAEIFDDHLCVWKHGQDDPVLRIPIHSANTHVLLRLLRERIAPHPDDGGPRADDGLGRILFERKPGTGLVALVWLLPIAVVIVLAGSLFLAVFQGDRRAIWLGLEIGGILTTIWFFPLTQCVEFRVHEHGVRRKWLFRTQQLKFSDVDTFTYSAVRQYVKGVYSGTNFTVTFASQADGKLKKLTYTRTLRNADAELDHLRDSVSQTIADRMAAQFKLGKAVTWTDGLRLLPEALEYRAAGFFGRKAPIVIPYSQISGYDLHQ
ncbi:MAG: hypothetical protein ACM3U2_15155, partial [Deltaproteobacteria bacterium]